MEFRERKSKDDGFEPTPTYGLGYFDGQKINPTFRSVQQTITTASQRDAKNAKREINVGSGEVAMPRNWINSPSVDAMNTATYHHSTPHPTISQPRPTRSAIASATAALSSASSSLRTFARKQIGYAIVQTDLSIIPVTHPKRPAYRPGKSNIAQTYQPWPEKEDGALKVQAVQKPATQKLYTVVDRDLSILPPDHPESPAYRDPQPRTNSRLSSQLKSTRLKAALPSIPELSESRTNRKHPFETSTPSTVDTMTTQVPTAVENHFTVFIRLPYKRGTFIDPPPVSWSATKERELWDFISRQSKGNEIDWKHLSERFDVTEKFLLQQAAWLYERQLSQVRAQMRKVGNRQSATPSPVPGSVSASMVGGQAMKRAGSGGSRVPSRLSTQALGSPVIGPGDSAPGTPAKSRVSLPFRNPSGATNTNTVTQPRTAPGTVRPLSRQSSKDNDSGTAFAPTQSRRGSIQHQITRSPNQARPAPSAITQPSQPRHESSDSEDDLTQSRNFTRRPNPSSMHRRALSLRKDISSQRNSAASPIDQGAGMSIPPQTHDDDDDEDEDGPSFLPFATPSPVPQSDGTTSKSRPSSSQQQDPSATLRGTLNQIQTQNLRPNVVRRVTSERISSPVVEPPTPKAKNDDVTVNSPSSFSPTSTTHSHPTNPATHASNTRTSTTHLSRQVQTQPQASLQSRQRPSTIHPLSPPHRPILPTSLSSPRRHPAGTANNASLGPGSDTSPSMGSSFSDLEDASVTQSALEEALMSGMGNTASIMTVGGTSTTASERGNTTSYAGPSVSTAAGVAGRVTTGIGQALRSRYFDSRDGR